MVKDGYLDPLLLAQVRGLSARARLVVDGLHQGLHKSPHHGSSIEFSEHKEYCPGDDMRHIDWKVLARADKYYVKRFQHESNATVHMVMDGSGSMNYGGEERLTKYQYSCVLSLALAQLYLRQQDAVGLVLATDSIEQHIVPRARLSHTSQLCSALESHVPAGGTNLALGLHTVGERARKRGLIYLVSDFLGALDAPF